MKQKSSEILQNHTLHGWLLSVIRQTSLWSTLTRAAEYARRFFLIWNIIKWTVIAVAVIEASAILLLTAAVILALLPALLFLIAVRTAASRVIGTRILARGMLDGVLSKQRIFILQKAGRFGSRFCAELVSADPKNTAVFVLCADYRQRFFCIRRRCGVFYIRHAFFFRLKKKYFDAVPDRLIYLL